MRSHYCGEVDASHVGEQVELCGWVHRRRDHGGVIFLDVRDRSGIVQVVYDPDTEESFATADRVRNEFVLRMTGRVRRRPEGTVNPDMATGEVEVLGNTLEILNPSVTPPFQLDEHSDAGEDVRLKHRYLDLRRPEMQQRLKQRAMISSAVRRYLESQGYWEVETPTLTRATPEGARDYLVPSRTHPGSFFALPQSPQIFKQLLMVSGLDKYYQIARCFRDEDLRADRQPEFTQIDIEMSFVEEADVMEMTENMLRTIFADVIDVQLPAQFPSMTYDEAMRKYGTDKPDLRFDNQIQTVNDIVIKSDFRVFTSVVENSGSVAGICVPRADEFSRKVIDELTKKTQDWGAKGLAYTKVGEAGLESGIAKFMARIADELIAKFNAKPGDILFF